MKLRNTYTILILFSFYFNGFTQVAENKELEKHILYADSLTSSNDLGEYVLQLKKSIKDSESGNLDLIYYNLAICYSAKKQTDSTCFYLSRCIRESSIYNNLILTDTDFDFLYQSPCWEKIENKIDSSYLAQNPEVTNKELAVELYHIFLKDQHARGLGLKKINQTFINSDRENLKRVEEIIHQYGWPTYSMVGKTSANGAFLVIQHSNTKIQRKYFNQLLNAAKRNEASKESVALLMDRISVHLKGMQVFGTQVYQIKDTVTGEPGVYKYFPIKDEANVDSLRNEFGLIPLKHYYALFGIDYKPMAK